uniref:Tumor necrosis factor receptor superfamily, member 11b n=1 Tax=Cyprinus carpio carpio TaxID=630221 RepID=A0A9J7Z4G1_CYPCA
IIIITECWFLFTVLLLPVLSGAGVAANGHTYRRTDPVTGQQLQCKRCPPGTRLGAHCTSSRETDCVPCGQGLFTEFWNYIPDCLRCDACFDHQRVVRPCNGTVNTVCECEAGFYWDQHFCRRHSECKPGHGVKASGTPHRDTVCEICPDGHFADVRKTNAGCVTHSACKTDEQLVLPGSRWHDNVCASCDHLTLKGTGTHIHSYIATAQTTTQITIASAFLNLNLTILKNVSGKLRIARYDPRIERIENCKI